MKYIEELLGSGSQIQAVLFVLKFKDSMLKVREEIGQTVFNRADFFQTMF
jgi:hypothetical protein